MEQTLQPGKTSLQSLIDLSDQLIHCKTDVAAANLMAGDLVNFFEEANHGDPADRSLYMIYLPENEIRAGILQTYTLQAQERLMNLHAQICNLVDSMKRESVVV